MILGRQKRRARLGSADTDFPYARLRSPKFPHGVGHALGAEERITDRLRQLGIPVEELYVDVAHYREFGSQARYASDYPDYYPANIAEKSLEHYIASRLLEPRSNDLYIDIASQHSPVPEIYSRLFNADAYRQDLAYPPGLNGNIIGSSAAEMPVPDGFADKMALHCSFEHFEGDNDMAFIAEVARVLKPGGMCCIVPLYLAESYGIQTDPEVAVRERIIFEEDAPLYAATGWGNRHGRFYDPDTFKSRVYERRDALDMRVFHIVNFSQVDASCYARFALLIAKPPTR